jgi:protein-S-isoprenylcysteine O-methyltransferase Ste14
MSKLLPPILLGIVLLLMALAHAAADVPVVAPESVRWGGALLALAGVGLAVAGRIRFARAGTEINTFAEPGRLVTDGIYRFTRNPIYLGLALVAGGAALACGAITSLLLAAAFVAVTDRWYIAFEEEQLAAKFGAAYQAYRRSTRRWI